MCSRTEIRVRSKLGHENGTLCFISPNRTLIMEDCRNRACDGTRRWQTRVSEVKQSPIYPHLICGQRRLRRGQQQNGARSRLWKAAGYGIVAEFYDAAASRADWVAEREGFAALLERIAGNGVRTVLVESPDRNMVERARRRSGTIWRLHGKH
jgi:hypothetical protein